MARINSGKYRHVVTFQRLRETQNLYGETSTNEQDNWEDAFTARVGVFPISGREALGLDADIRLGEISHRIVLRYTKGVESKMRIKFGTRIFDIISPPVNNYERNDELLLFCKERNPMATGANIYG
jgi:SPP1 family predicted phage head-tail adaptor